eukprot:1158446-Pelagomonas_calceolata.AAC.7
MTICWKTAIFLQQNAITLNTCNISVLLTCSPQATVWRAIVLPSIPPGKQGYQTDRNGLPTRAPTKPAISAAQGSTTCAPAVMLTKPTSTPAHGFKELGMLTTGSCPTEAKSMSTAQKRPLEHKKIPSLIPQVVLAAAAAAAASAEDQHRSKGAVRVLAPTAITDKAFIATKTHYS